MNDELNQSIRSNWIWTTDSDSLNRMQCPDVGVTENSRAI